MLIDYREEAGGVEKERHHREGETPIGCLPFALDQGSNPPLFGVQDDAPAN